MAVLQNIRVKLGVFISILIALALLSFIIDPSTLESALASMSSKYDVGQIAGNPVSYTNFQETVDKYTTIQEMLTGSSVSTDEQQRQIRDAAWQEYVDKYLFIKKAQSAGIKVGKNEVVECTTGNHISPVIVGSPAFTDQNGSFSREAVVNFVQNLDADQSGRYRTYWNFLQNSVYTQEYYAKYGAIMRYSDMSNKLGKDAMIAANNTLADVEFVSVPYSYEPDSTITVSAGEIKAYYKAHKETFKQKAGRDIEYVVYEVVPSQEDIAAVNDEISAVYDEFATTGNVKNFLLKNSDRPLSDYWFKKGELLTINKDVNDFVFSATQGTSEIFQSGNTFYVARIMATAQIPDSVYVKHILIQGNGAKATADSLLQVLKGGAKFSDIAALYSADQNSAADGELGAIGWMTQTYMIPGFESVITAEVGKPYRVETAYGSHIVLVSKKTAPVLKKQVALLEKETLASKETFNVYYSQANTFASITAGTSAGYKKALDSLGVYSHNMPGVQEGTSAYGAIEQAKEVTRWAFDHKKGDASGIITVNNNYFFIVSVNDTHKEGYATLKEATKPIKQVLFARKTAAKQFAAVAEKVNGMTSLESIAEALNTSVFSEQGVSCSALNSRLDPGLVGAMLSAPEDKICGPIDGVVGAYIFKVSNKNVGTFFTEEDVASQEVAKIQFNTQALLDVMMEDANVVDNRERFY